jgi:hypothetical protein
VNNDEMMAALGFDRDRGGIIRAVLMQLQFEVLFYKLAKLFIGVANERNKLA